jgi:DNA-binding CsgD family transcriptional regulator
MRASMTGEMAARHLRSNYATDVVDLAGHVTCPVLVFHSRRDEMVLFEQGRKLAAAVPGSRFVPLEASAHYLLVTDPANPVFEREMEAFLHPGEAAGARLTPRQAEVLAQVSAGQTDKEIARTLQLSPRTVEMHVAGAMKALDSATRAEAVAKAAAAGLLA